MTDTSRKRSRKTKLELRKCVETDEEHISDLQMNSAKASKSDIISSINYFDHDYLCFHKSGSKMDKMPNQNDDFEALIDNESNISESQREFSVTVAVEQFDEDSSDLVIIEPKYEEPVIIDDDSSDDAEITTSIVESPEVFANEIMGHHFLSRHNVLAATKEIMEGSNNVADKVLGIQVRNCLGHFQNYIQNPFEMRFQRVLNQWLGWQRLIDQKYRSSPLFYKCYMCEKSWWYLENFREHLKCHSNFKLDLEEYTIYEANVIAYNSVEEIVDIKHFHTEGNCPKCENEFVIHKTTVRFNNRFYSCKVVQCKKVFPTCFAMAAHENDCHSVAELKGSQHMAIKWRKSCEVCGLSFNTQASYQSHMILMHSVRSDVVMALVRYKKCLLCKARYLFKPNIPSSFQHGCPMQGIMGKCNNCYRTFPQTLLFKSHVNAKGAHICRICNVYLPKWCMETEHLMEHTDKFELVKRCIACVKFVVFRDDRSAAYHETTTHHAMLKEHNTGCFDTILVPKACLHSNPAEPQQPRGIDAVPNITINDENVVSEEVVETQPNSSESTEKPKETVEAPVLEIKQEIIDEFQPTTVAEESDAGDFEEYEDIITIKEEETSIRKNRDHNEYCIKIEEPNMHSKIFGVKIEPIQVKQEMQDEESEYEDDIIRLDENFLQGGIKLEMQDNMQEDMQEDMQEELQEEVQNIVNYNGPVFRRTRKLYTCRKCGFEAHHKEYKEHRKQECIPVFEQLEPYNCTKCSTSYEEFDDYVKHFVKHGFREKSCPVCFRTFSTELALVSHVEVHIKMRFFTLHLPGEPPKIEFKCKICVSSVDKCDFFNHWEGHLALVEKNKVKSESNGSETTLNKPIGDPLIQELIHRLQSREYTARMLHAGCMICHKFFARKNDCKRHLIEHLLNDAYAQRPENHSLKCQICGRFFTKAEKYKQHMRDHASLPVYRCELCDKSFSDSSNFTKHKKLHNRDAYTCDICGRKFQAKISIEKHMEIHVNEKPITCEPCNKVFHLKSAYKKHMRVKHSRLCGQFRCMVCLVRFDSLKEKWDHMWFEHKEREHKADCQYCSQSYRRFRDLKNHMKTAHRTDFKYNKTSRAQSSRRRIQLLLKTAKIKGAGGRKETLIVY